MADLVYELLNLCVIERAQVAYKFLVKCTLLLFFFYFLTGHILHVEEQVTFLLQIK